MRKILVIAMTICMLLTVAASAATNAVSAVPGLSYTGTTANCSGTVTAAGQSIVAVVSIWRGNAILDSWSDSGSNMVSIEETYDDCISNVSYTVKLSGTVGGVSFGTKSITRTCP